MRCVAAVLLHAAAAAAAGFLTPPMGFSTWNLFPYKGVTEAWCVEQADALVSSGLVAAGYSVFIVDEPCFVGRDAGGALQENRTAWPRGLKWFAGYLSDRNMTLGIYTDAGPLTCQQCPGSAGHERQDMATFEAWGAGYVKVDRCFGVDSEKMRSSLPQTFDLYRYKEDGSDTNLVISAILAGTDNCWLWGRGGAVINHCRTTEDIRNSFGSVLGNLDNQERVPYIDSYAGPGSATRAYFNDLDMLVVGLPPGGGTPGPGLTEAEARSHLSLWAVLKSPLLFGANASALPPALLSMLTNPEMIAVSQDSLGVQGRRVRFSGSVGNGISYQGCAPTGRAVDPSQLWSFDKGTGRLTSTASGKCATAVNCGSKAGTAVRLCDCNVSASSGSDCGDATCVDGGRRWTWDSAGRLASAAAPALCAQALLGPGATRISLDSCSSDTRQIWKAGADGTVAAAGQCLTAEPLPNAGSTTDLYVAELSTGAAAVVVFNRGSGTVNATVDFHADLGWPAASRAKLRDVWARSDVGAFTSQWQGSVPAHGAMLFVVTRA